MLTQKYLKSILNYNPGTGIFTWKISRSNRIKVGDAALAYNEAANKYHGEFAYLNEA